jgi:hypothetical protein
MEFTKFDLFSLIDVARGAQHGKERRSETFDLWPLMGGDGVIDGEFVQPELSSDGPNFFNVWSVESDPGHTFSLAQYLVGLFEVLGVSASPTIHVDGVIHNCHVDLDRLP